MGTNVWPHERLGVQCSPVAPMSPSAPCVPTRVPGKFRLSSQGYFRGSSCPERPWVLPAPGDLSPHSILSSLTLQEFGRAKF